MQLDNIIQIISHNIQIADKEAPYIIAIDGMCGSGKTTLAQNLHKTFPASNLFCMDHYFLQAHQRTAARLAEIGGNVDYERFKQEVLLHIHDREGLYYHIYNCQNYLLGPAIYVPWQPLVIVEGAYSHHPYFGNPYNLRIFCEIDPQEQKTRILQRNGAEMLNRFITEWIPKENLYFETYHIKEKSELSC